MAKILIVEDDPALGQTYDIVLQRHGHTVLRAYDGEQGLAMAESESPDLILLDILMPRMNGMKLLKEFDIKNKHPDTKVIAFSNMDSKDLQSQALNLGAIRYEVKSNFSPNQLAVMVNSVLSGHSKENLAA